MTDKELRRQDWAARITEFNASGLTMSAWCSANGCPIDQLKDGLAALVQEGFGLSPFSSSLFVFCNRERIKLKILYWDHNGFWLSYRRYIFRQASRQDFLPKQIRLHRLVKRRQPFFGAVNHPIGHRLPLDSIACNVPEVHRQLAAVPAGATICPYLVCDWGNGENPRHD